MHPSPHGVSQPKLKAVWHNELENKGIGGRTGAAPVPYRRVPAQPPVRVQPLRQIDDVLGVDADVIEQLAVDYATVRPAGIRSLIGAEHHENGAMFYRTLACLPALTGAWAERGGGIAKSVGSYSEDLIDVAALFRPDLERAGGRPEPRTLNMSLLGEILTSPHAGGTEGPGVHALIVWNCNPLATVPRAELIRRGMERDDLFTGIRYLLRVTGAERAKARRRIARAL